MSRPACRWIAATLVLLVASPVAARHTEWKNWSVHFGGGAALPVAGTSDRVDTGWGLQFGMTTWFGDRPLGLTFEAAFTALAFSDRTLAALDVPSGDVDVWPFSLSMVFSPAQRGSVGYYVLSGAGPYLLHAKATAPTSGSSAVCDDWWWGWCFPGSPSGSIVLGSVTELEFGLTGGLGLTFDVGKGSSLYIEGRYHHVFVTGDDVQVVPLAFGLRW